jgi:hypothetical protein
VFIAAFVHLILVYPGGDLITRYARRLVVAGYATSVLAPLFDLMFASHKTCKPNECPDNLLLVTRNHGAHIAETAVWTAVAVLLFLAAFMLLVGRWRRATPALRRILRPVYLAGALSLLCSAWASSSRPSPAPATPSSRLR